MTDFGFNTTLLHGVDEKNPFGTTQVPIYQSSAFRHESAEELEKIFTNKAMGFSYTRINNPTVEAFEKRITKLEGGIGSVACASGMAALFNAFMNILCSGDEIVAAAGLYGGTVELFEDLQAFGITTKYVKKNVSDEYEALITDKTRAIFAETIGNPKLDVTDIATVAEVAHRHNLPFIVDNTMASPYLIQPIALGADVVVNSSSKYINGNSDAISGILTYGGKIKWDEERYPGMKPYQKFGNMGYIVKLRNGLFRNTGACLSPQNAFYNLLGLETLGLRMERQCANALHLAEFLDSLDAGIIVNYPGLPNNPYYELAKRQLKGGFGAVVTVRVGSKDRAFRIINALKLPYILSNIGDTKTLVIHPASTIAVHLSEKERIAALIDAFMGIILAWVLVRYDFPGKKIMNGIIELPFALPTAVAGISLTHLTTTNGWVGSFFHRFGIEIAYTRVGITVALVFVGIPFVVRAVQPVLEKIDVQYEEAANILGANGRQTMFHVILPEIMPALIGGFTMSFARGFGEYGSVVFIAGNTPYETEIAPLMIMSELQEFDYASATSIALVMLLAAFIILFVNAIVQSKVSKIVSGIA